MVDHEFYDTHANTTSEWYTPISIFKALDKEFNFVTDAAAEKSNRLACPVFFTKDTDGLKDHLNRWRGSVFINPPYSDGQGVVYRWVKAASEYSRKTGNAVVMLLRSTTEVKWFHDFVWDDTKDTWHDGVKVKFPDKRIQFVSSSSSSSSSNPDLKLKRKSGTTFASIIVIFQGEEDNEKEGE